MATFHTINFTGKLAINNRPIVCPTCGADKQLSVFGHMGQPAHLRCPNGHETPMRPPFDGPDLIAVILSSPGVS